MFRPRATYYIVILLLLSLNRKLKYVTRKTVSSIWVRFFNKYIITKQKTNQYMAAHKNKIHQKRYQSAD